MSTLKVTNIQDTSGGNSLTTEQLYNGSAKAWVNFNGTGTVAIRASFNVSSITDNGVGDYTVNFTNALSDANYSKVIGGGGAGGLFFRSAEDTTATTSSLFRLYTAGTSGTNTDYPQISVAVFR